MYYLESVITNTLDFQISVQILNIGIRVHLSIYTGNESPLLRNEVKSKLVCYMQNVNASGCPAPYPDTGKY